MSGANNLFLTLAVSLALTAAAAAAEQGVTADTIIIGAFGPITGPAAYIGLAGRDGAAMAIKEINAAGGINGRKLNMTFEDDGHSPAKALAAVKKLVDDDKVFALFNVAGSNGTIGTIDYVKEKGLSQAASRIARAERVARALLPDHPGRENGSLAFAAAEQERRDVGDTGGFVDRKGRRTADGEGG